MTLQVAKQSEQLAENVGEVLRDAIEGILQIATHGRNGCDNADADDPGNQGVLDRGCTVVII